MSLSSEIAALIVKKLQETITPAEADALEAWAARDPANRALLNRLQDEQQVIADVQAFDALWGGAAGAERYTRMEHEVLTATAAPVRRLWRHWLPYAAAVLLFVSAATIWYLRQPGTTPQTELSSHYGADVLPGYDRARITLADGRVIDLDSAGVGLLTREQGVSITKDENGLIAYEKQDEAAAAGASASHTIATPRGGQYRLILPDGTRVWLNAASALTYPTRFTGRSRVVELQGEAYFEVSKQYTNAADGKQVGTPFIVKTFRQEIEVLGTRFNVSAYPDDPDTRTTLVEGAVRVAPSTEHHSPITLKPGQQFLMRGRVIRIEEVDVDQYVAWKDGVFAFYNLGIAEMIRQIERWYDVKFDTTNMPPDDSRFSGEIRRDVRLSTLLDLMQHLAAPRYRIQGRRVVVYK